MAAEMGHNSNSEEAGLLKRVGLKVTQPRIHLLELLRKHHGPYTMEELHRKLEKNTCDLATVYRSLMAFEEAGVIKRCEFGDGSSRFEFNEEGEHHHHVVCRKCHKVESLDLCIVEEIERFLEKKGYTEISHSLEFFGVCDRCRPTN